MAKDSFILYKSFWKPIASLSDEALGRLFRALYSYQLGEKCEVDSDIYIAYFFFKNQFEIDENKYDRKVENIRNARNQARSRNTMNRDDSMCIATNHDESAENGSVNVNVNDNVNVNVNSNVSVHENGSTYAQSESTAPSAPPEILLPLNDKTEYPVTKEQTAQWAELYPSVNILQELRKMRGWLLANPNRRKTRNGILRFITSWLAREQDRSKTPPKPKIPSSPYDFAALEKAALNKMMNGPRG